MSGSNQSEKNEEGWCESHGRGGAIAVKDNLSEKIRPFWAKTITERRQQAQRTEVGGHLKCSRNGKANVAEHVQEKSGKTSHQREWEGRFCRIYRPH